MSAQELVRIVELLARQVSHWTPERWAAPAFPGGASRAELVHGLVQRLADVAADAEGEVRRPVPRLDNDLGLPDQLRVMAADLVTSGASDLLLHAAAADVGQVRSELSSDPLRRANPGAG
jgi:hypothetical protein